MKKILFLMPDLEGGGAERALINLLREFDYTKYKAGQEKPLPKFKYFSQMMADLRMILEEEIKPLLITV